MLRGEIDEATAIQRLENQTGASYERAQRSIRFSRQWPTYFVSYACGYYKAESLFKRFGAEAWKHLYI